MDNFIVIKSYQSEHFDIGEILRYAGVRGDAPDLCGLIDECIKEIESEISYRVCYREFPIEFGVDFVELGFMRTSSESLRRNLVGCQSIILFAATVGVGVDRLIARYSSISPTKALLFQAIGAERIESLCDAFCRDMSSQKARAGLFVRPRFSAGYGDFLIDAQKDIFSVLDCPRKIGLTLNESLVMSPSKSVTAIIGVG